MAKGTKVAIKVKGSPKGVKKAISEILNTAPSETVTPLRQADFRLSQKRNNNAR